MSPTSRVISGLGTETIPAIGTSEIVVVLPNVSIDVLFTVVPDNVMASNLAAISGWDVISRANVKIKKGIDDLELHHDLSNTGNVLTIAETDAFDDLEVTRLAERDLARLKQPLIRDLLDSLRHARYLTTLDMKSGFHKMEIDEGSKHITAFITTLGLYEYHRMPFGLVNAPAVYQRAIDKALGKLKGAEAHVYMDDVLIPSESIEEGLQRLENVLHALANAGFSLNYRKCTFLAEENT
jgi:hypothetical protein